MGSMSFEEGGQCNGTRLLLLHFNSFADVEYWSRSIYTNIESRVNFVQEISPLKLLTEQNPGMIV